MKIRIYYEDTDIGGITYHTNYFKYCERARSELFFQKDISPIYNNSHFVVRDIEARFISTSTIKDILEVKTKIIEKKRISVKLNQSIYKENKIIFNMDIILAFICDNKLSKIPNEFYNILEGG